MHHCPPDRWLLAFVVAVPLVAAWPVVPLHAQEMSKAQVAPAPPGPAQRPAAEEFTNVQVLKDMPASQLRDAMVFFGASLGTNCGFCHVRSPQGQFSFEKDDKPEKKTARKMIQLVRTLNTQFFDGDPTVTCATCHQARHQPRAVPPLAQVVSPEQAALASGRDALGRAPSPVETADQVIDRYVQALGGADALAAVTTLVMRGTSAGGAAEATPVLVEEMAPDRYRATVETTPPVSRVVDGANGWIQAGNAGRALHGVERQALAVSEQLGLPLRVKKYARLTVVRYDRLDGHDVVLLEGGPSPSDAETLYFDRKSNLLLRRVARLPTPMGRLPVQIDYADYRDVGGIKLPFEIRATDWESLTVQKFSDIKVNAPVEATRFSKPSR